MVSTHSKEIHEEVHSYQCLDCCIVDMAYCVPLNKAGESWRAVLDVKLTDFRPIAPAAWH